MQVEQLDLTRTFHDLCYNKQNRLQLSNIVFIYHILRKIFRMYSYVLWSFHNFLKGKSLISRLINRVPFEASEILLSSNNFVSKIDAAGEEASSL